MGHPAFEFENWQKLAIDNQTNMSYNNKVSYYGMNIDASKFYFFLKEKYGSPTVHFSSVSHLFPEKDIITGREWCYIFYTRSDFILIAGDDRINMTVLSMNEAPSELDFNIFTNQVNKSLEIFDMRKYHDLEFNLFLNYSCLLRKFIDEKIEKVNQKMPLKPDPFNLHVNEINSNEPEIEYKKIEYSKDYNNWTKAVIERATETLQLQILLPIYLESLIDLAFRIKLQKRYFNKSKCYEINKKNMDIFEYFIRQNIQDKLSVIIKTCA